MADEERSGLQDAAEGDAFEARLKALTEYHELVERRRRGEARAGDRGRGKELRALLDRTGRVPGEASWYRA